jgi:hypothetical protein
MDVVGHEHVGMEGAVPIGSRLLEPVEVASAGYIGRVSHSVATLGVARYHQAISIGEDIRETLGRT